MHPCLSVDEILRLIAYALVASGTEATVAALACCCKTFEGPMLDALWEKQHRLTPLLKCFPEDVWKEEDGSFTFERIPTKAEWADFRRYARRIQSLHVYTSDDSAAPDVLLALQLRTGNEPFLPRLKTFECVDVMDKAFIPFIPLFLSPKTIEINITFAQDSPTVAIASMISRFSTLCPDLENIDLRGLPRNSVITDAVSEMVLGCNPNSLRVFQVDSPLTEEAREVVYQLPRLTSLWARFKGPTSLPTVVLPDLTMIEVEYKDDFSWLRGFRGAEFGRLERVSIVSRSNHIGDFLGVFESVAFTTAIQDTLSKFSFYTSRSWNPNYRALLSFRQLKKLEIRFSCRDNCPPIPDDDIIISLAQAMPKLEILRLGEDPCETPNGVTVNGLTGLAHRCPHLSKLRIHFQATSLVDAVAVAVTRSLSEGEPSVQRRDCALTDLEVGEILIPTGSASSIFLILLQIFPHIENLKFKNQEWKAVAETIRAFRQIGAFVHRSAVDAVATGRPSGDT